MTRIEQSALLPYSARQLFELVNDIEAYPVFLDGCVGARVLKRDGDVIEAQLDLKKGGFRQSFSTRNRTTEHEVIAMQLMEGPFDRFEGEWRFHALAEDACKVSLNLEFALSGVMASVASEKMFSSVAGNLVNAISNRARVLYGQ